jgi:hypothetical protein
MASRKLKILGWTLSSVLLIGIGVGVWVPKITLFSLPGGEVRQLDTPAIIQKIQGISQLVTVKYVIEKVIVLEDAKWYGENRVLLVAHGIAKAGIDLGKLQPADIVIEGKSLKIFLPAAQITDCYLDEHKTHVIERTTGMLRLFDKDLEQNARRAAIDDIRRAARLNGIIKDAEQRAEQQLEGLFLQLGFDQVDVIPHSGVSTTVQ